MYGVAVTFIVMGCVLIALLCVAFVWTLVARAHEKDKLVLEDGPEAMLHRDSSEYARRPSRWKGLVSPIPSSMFVTT